jgi:hypothetical protein
VSSVLVIFNLRCLETSIAFWIYATVDLRTGKDRAGPEINMWGSLAQE